MFSCSYERFVKSWRCPAGVRICPHYKRGKCLIYKELMKRNAVP